MAGYQPLKITGMQTGLVQERENFLLPDDAYPVLQNAYVWRERIKRKRGYELLGRLQRTIGMTNGAGNAVIFITYPLPILTGISSFTVTDPITGLTDSFVDPGTTPDPAGQLLITNGTATGQLFRTTGQLNIVNSKPNSPIQYFPGLPVMGIRSRDLSPDTTDQTVVFDQVYAYKFNAGTGIFEDFISPLPSNSTWNAHLAGVDGVDFFWSTNYWTSQTTIPGTATPFFTTSDQKLFWVTNNTSQFGAPDPIRITDGVTWINFNPPNFGQIDATSFLVGCLSFLPFRGRMVTFNTYEGPALAGAIHYPNRIRWSRIGNPFIPFSAGPPATGSWRSDIRGQGGFLDIPTSEDIVAIGFVRDNLVIFCERSTWQLRYTGRSIAPFQIERVNSELGAESAFAAIEFDTSLLTIGDRGILECDSYKAERIDIKIPDFVFQFNFVNKGYSRVHGIRDYPNRLAYWTVPIAQAYDGSVPPESDIFPNIRLVYNYENDSWALFNDSLTALGTYQAQKSPTWLDIHIPWVECNFPWISEPQGDPEIVGGNQQGFVERLDELTTNDVSLFITNIVGQTTTATVVTSPNHNMNTGFVIGISGLTVGQNYDNLNGGIFGIVLGDETGSNTANKFRLFLYNSVSMQFDIDQLDPPLLASSGGLINIRENFSIKSKKFNFLDEGQSIQMGYLDILMAATEPDQPGAISLFVYLDYDDSTVSNTTPQNEINDYSLQSNPDTFFNSVIPTISSTLNNVLGTKFWQRVFCPTRANFITLEYTFSNAQLAAEEQTKDVQIDAQVLWIRKGGRLTSI